MNHSLLTSTFLGLAFAFGVVEVAQADTVTLNNGREIHGRLVQENAEDIWIRTGQGTIKIPKFRVATFSENENWGQYGRPRSVEELRKIEEDKTREAAEAAARRKGDGGEGGEDTAPAPVAKGPKQPAAGGGKKDGEWTWGANVTAEQIEALTPIRDKLIEERKGLGKTEEERLKEIELSGEQENALQQEIKMLGWIRGRGGARRGGRAGSAPRREAARKKIVQTYGVKAIPSLVKALGSASLWQARTASTTLMDVAANAQNKDDMRWLMYHFKAPQSLLRLMDNEGDTLSPFVRGDANAAMEKVTGATQKWPPIKDKPTDNTELRSRAETQAYRAWQKWWGKEAAKFKKEQEAGKKRRAEIAEQLEKIRQGENPLEEKES
ncbi:MAG TPA: hypothetical protein DEA08_02615 [Planctomycetes bacterium]|nr:hypothetical protein [Planctomycetota bacterium]|tara:strand:- start:197 stop:1339 length:1143 start_codon:yes stop_codon:yes gene_type:complete